MEKIGKLERTHLPPALRSNSRSRWNMRLKTGPVFCLLAHKQIIWKKDWVRTGTENNCPNTCYQFIKASRQFISSCPCPVPCLILNMPIAHFVTALIDESCFTPRNQGEFAKDNTDF